MLLITHGSAGLPAPSEVVMVMLTKPPGLHHPMVQIGLNSPIKLDTTVALQQAIVTIMTTATSQVTSIVERGTTMMITTAKMKLAAMDQLST